MNKSISICSVSKDTYKFDRMLDSLDVSKYMSHSVEESRVSVNVYSIKGDKDQYDIFSGYNKAIEMSKDDYIVFVHDDVEFLCNSNAWSDLFRLLDQDDTGFVGVAGTRLLDTSGIWWNTLQTHGSGAVMHCNKEGNEWMTAYGVYGQTIVLDGVFLAARRSMLEYIGGFDSSHYKGFHFYDIDTTLQAHTKGYKNYTIPLLLKHHSIGDTANNVGWAKNRKIFLKLWEKQLPIRM